nr:MAG TPA: TraY domain [Caudoviricetes sp.]
MIQCDTKEGECIEMTDNKKDVKVLTSMRIEEKLLNKVKAEAKRRKRSIAFVVNEKLRKSYEKSK